MSNVTTLLYQRSFSLFDPSFTHTIRSNLTLALDLTGNTELQLKSKHPSYCLDIDKTGEFLLSGDSGGGVSVHEVHKIEPSTNNVLQPVSHKRKLHKFSITSVSWYPLDTGVFVTGSTDKQIKICDTNAMVPVDQIKLKGHVYDISMSKRTAGKTTNLVAAACSDNRVMVCDLRTGSATHTLRGHEQAVNCVTWSHRNSYTLLSGGRDGKIITWDVRRARSAVSYFDQDNRENEESAHHGAVTSITQTQDGFLLLSTGQDRKVRCWDIAEGRNTYTNFGNDCASVDVKKVQSAVTVNSCYPGLVYVPNGGEIRVYDVLTGQNLSDYKVHFNGVNAVQYNWHYPALYTCSNDGAMRVLEPVREDQTGLTNSDTGTTEMPGDTWSDSD